MRASLCALVAVTAFMPLLAAEDAQSSEPARRVPEMRIPDDVELEGSFTLRALVRLPTTSSNLPLVVANKDWTSGEVRDYTSNDAFGIGRESGVLGGFALSVLPDGAWTWNAGDGRRRLDHRPEAADQGVADGRWHEVGFSVDRAAGVVHLFHDGERVALLDLQGLGSLAGDESSLRIGAASGLEVDAVRMEPGVVAPEAVAAAFVDRFGTERRPSARAIWDGERPLKILAWNIWHGGRRKGRDEGVQRVVDVIRDSGADIVLMQETYGSGPRIAGRLDFEFYLRSSNLSVMSRFPIRDVHRLFQGFRFGGATLELAPGQQIQAYSLWIHHLPSVQRALEEGASAADLERADAKTRGAEMEAILDELLPHLASAPHVPVIVGGDFNSGSHLDWTEAATGMPSHRGLVVDWPAGRRMERARFVDTFREVHPDPASAPGFTWSPEFTDSHPERIDYVYASQGDWRTIDSRVVDTHPEGWPSDHAAVLSTLALVPPAPAIRFMSYNVHYGVGMDGVSDLERIARVITDAQPDVVGLQEIASVAMAEELGRLTGMRTAFGASQARDDAYGDAVLSRYPFEWVGNLSLPSASSSRYQAMAVDVDVSSTHGAGTLIRFVNTHYDWTDSIGSQEARRVSSSVIERGLTDSMPALAVLAGDLNAGPGSPPLEALEGLGWHLPGLGADLATHPANAPMNRIDHVLVRPLAAWRVVESSVVDAPLASDHAPVVLDVRPVR